MFQPFNALTVGGDQDHVAPGHGAVDGRQGVELDHDEPPHGQGEGQPDGHGVNHDAEVDVEPDDGRPGPAVLLLGGATLGPEVEVGAEGDVVQHEEHVSHGNTCKNGAKILILL